MSHWLIDPRDSLERQNAKLLKISEALMARVEQDTNRAGTAYAQFERAALLEAQVRARTSELERALDLLNQSNAALARAKQEAEQARSDLTTAIEAVQEGFALFDASERLALWNSRFAAQMPDVRAVLCPGFTFDAYVDAVSRSPVLERPKGESPEVWAAQRRRRHADPHTIFNTRLTGARWLQVSEHRTAEGATVVLQTDVTDIMRLEREERGRLVDTQSRTLRATLDHLDQGVCIFDDSGRLLGSNTRVGELLSIPAQTLRRGMGFDRLLVHLRRAGGALDVSAGDLRRWAGQAGGRRPLRFEMRQQADITLDVFAREMPDRGFVISFTDVSAERRAARELSEAKDRLERRVLERTLDLQDALAVAERANASKTRFVAAASHDLLQPLSAAKLYLAALQEGPAEDGQSAEAARKALSALSSAEDIIEALLDISRLDAGAARLSLTEIAVADLLRGLADEFAPAAGLRGLRLRVRPGPAGLIVRSDAGFLRRILQNLIANAVRYTAQGAVLVAARPAGAGLRFEVWDTGPGIAEADQERIFEEFARLGPRESAAHGLGLGLAIVERACAQLGHPLDMRSVPGRGTVFRVTVPLAVGRPSGPLGPALDTPPDRRLETMAPIVLLVEDDAEVRAALTLLMERWGCDVLEAEGHDAALALLDEIGILPDAALIDHGLGAGPDGLTLTHALRARRADLPVRIMSANRAPRLEKAVHRAGIALLPKPLDTDSLRAFLVEAAQQQA